MFKNYLIYRKLLVIKLKNIKGYLIQINLI